MSADTFIQFLVTFMTAVTVLAGIPLAVATVVRLVVSFFQAVTQIQDQTLAQTVKIVAIGLTFLLMGAALIGPLMEASERVFSTFWRIR